MNTFFKRLRQITLGLIFPLLLIGALATMHWEGLFRVDEVELAVAEGAPLPKGLESAWEQFVVSAQVWKGRDLWSLQLSMVEEELRRLPWIEQVTVAKRWPQALSIEVVPRKLKAYVRAGKGRLVPVLEGGLPLSESDVGPLMSLPVLGHGISLERAESLGPALQILSLMPEELWARVSEMGVDQKEGYWATVLPFGTRVKFGFDSFEPKLLRVHKVLEYLDSRELNARVIDSNLSKKVVVRLRKAP